ncbi:MAG: sigma-54-dependent transcriptional regulator [Puniceicoccaceae bacterium]
MPATLLIVDDEKHTREGLRAVFEQTYDVYAAQDAKEAFNLFEVEKFDLVLTDLKMAGKSGMTVIDRTLQLNPPPVCIMMTAYGSVETAVEAMKRGAYDFITKPINLEKLEIMVQRALRSRELESENQNLHERLDRKFTFNQIIGTSPKLEEILEKVRLVAPSRATILIEGETGTGKELIAQSIHQNSPRARHPFIAVHCAALASNLLESELFGHEKGAFTGAAEKRIGRFEAADKGTLFLDEIGEIDSSTQVKLLRFLESRSFERLGSNKEIPVDVRLVCATNRNLEKMVRKGDFREDLFFRLNVVRLPLPPLRERKEDIPHLLEHYLNLFSRENGFPLTRLSSNAIRILSNYAWPGNIRELRNFAENTVVLKQGGEVDEYDLDPRFILGPEEDEDFGSGSLSPEGKSLTVEDNEKRLLRNALVKSRGNKTRAAEMLGISRRTLHRKLAQWPDLDR